ncbi:MAG: amidohydrolase family protein [Verrucomicrobiota bacterium]|nr:amidohydrolase family protein [Limisphaera sp.]MDW8382402.1 amidohydrolase family protein [Verrucomicrobiota bacterium]
MTGPPVPDAVVRIHRGRIHSVGRWRECRPPRAEPGHDFGSSVLLPGLINAHCHLDYTDMAGRIPPRRSFTDWIKLITMAKAEWDLEEYRRSWLHGATMLLRTGTTTVADVEAVPELLPSCWEETPLRVISFIEMTGIRARRDPADVLAGAAAVLNRLQHPRCRAAFSPHAPYSTRPALLQQAATLARQRGLLLMTHVAESEEEYAMFRRAAGPMYEWLQRNERDMSDCGGVTPVQHLHRAGYLGPNLLAVHVNYLGWGDARLLARHRVTVVHCPRSHRYFGHAPFPWRRLMHAGVRVCVGTDSLATVLKDGQRPLELNLWDELRELRRREPWISPMRLLQMVTVEPARALGLQGPLGELRAGACADLIVVPLGTVPKTARQVWHAVLEHDGPVTASFIEGRPVLPLLKEESGP